MDIQIIRAEEKFRFNLFREVKISEGQVQKEILSQPSSYGFLTLLQTDLLKILSEKKIEEKRAYASAYIKYKSQRSEETGRPNSDDVAKNKAELDKRYIEKQKEVIETQFNLNRITACVRAFEQRKDMLQTLSANNRKEIR